MLSYRFQVWCAAISSDHSLVVSGSRDGTIRLWRAKGGNQISGFHAGMDIFSVQISDDKTSIVALGDKYHSRKLIILQVRIERAAIEAYQRQSHMIGAKMVILLKSTSTSK
jgi:WD40 repeat protein